MNFFSQLNDPKTYLDEISRIEDRYYCTEKMLCLRQDDVTLSHIIFNKQKIAKQLALSMQKEQYRFAPATTRTCKIKDKKREIFCFRITDFIIHGVVARILTEMADPHFSPQLFSFRKEMSNWEAVRSFSQYVKYHHRTNKETASKGLYVLRLDVSEYGDNIPVGDSSPFWTLLAKLFKIHDETPSPYVMKVIKNVIRPDVRTKGCGLLNRIIGIPTGSAISPFIDNLYLMDLDHSLSKHPDVFFARFGDDMCIASPDADKIQDLRSLIAHNMGELQISTNVEKEGFYYFNLAGRKPLSAIGARGTTKVEYLGCVIDFNGTISLTKSKAGKFINEVKRRINQSAYQLQELPCDQQGEIICSALTKAFNPTSSLKLPYADYLRWIITDRGQLKQLDYTIALLVAQKIAGLKSVRAFRHIPYRRIRSSWKLPSLVAMRNRYGKRGRPAQPRR